MKIHSTQRLGVNVLKLHTSRGPRLLIAGNEISARDEVFLSRNVETWGFRRACAGIGRVSKIASPNASAA